MIRAGVKPLTIWWCVFAAFTAVSLWPIWSERFPAMQDYPSQLARARILITPENSTLDFHENFEIHLSPLYATFFLVTKFCSRLVSFESAGKMALSLYPILVAVLVAMLARGSKPETPPWGVLSLFPLAFNQAYFLGFVNFCYSVPLLLLALLHQQSLASARLSPWKIGQQLLLQILLFITHPFTFLTYVALVTVAVALNWRKKTEARAMAAAPVITLLLLLTWLVVAKSIGLLSGPAGQPSFSWKPLRETLGFYCYMFTGIRWHDGVDWSTIGIWTITFACAFFALLTGGKQARRHSREVAVFFVLTTLAVLALPFFVYDRNHLPYAFFNFRMTSLCYFFLGWLAGNVQFRGVCSAIFVGCLVILSTASACKQVRISREIQEIAPLIEKIPPNARILPLVFNPNTPELDPVYFDVHLHAAEFYHALVGGGISPYFGGDPLHPVALKPGFTPPAPGEYTPYLFSWQHHGAAYQYFLVREAPESFISYMNVASELIARSGAWLLFQRK